MISWTYCGFIKMQSSSFFSNLPQIKFKTNKPYSRLVNLKTFTFIIWFFYPINIIFIIFNNIISIQFISGIRRCLVHGALVVLVSIRLISHFIIYYCSLHVIVFVSLSYRGPVRIKCRWALKSNWFASPHALSWFASPHALFWFAFNASSIK